MSQKALNCGLHLSATKLFARKPGHSTHSMLQNTADVNNTLMLKNTSLTARCRCSLQAYMSALTSTIQVLEQQVGTVNATSSSLASTLSQAFGDDSLQRDSQLDVQVMQLYQVCRTIAGVQGFTKLSACSTSVTVSPAER
jgi:hypothetical protein